MKHSFAIAALLLAACGNSGGSAETPSDKAAAAPAAEKTPAERGRQAFNECGVCHSVREGEPSRVGPNLFGVYGRAAGTLDGFAFSAAMTESAVVWDDETLDAYLANPQQFMRGTRMAYAGKADPETRADIIAFLKTLTTETD